MGKGDTYRPVDRKKYEENYDRIFRKDTLDGGNSKDGSETSADFDKSREYSEAELEASQNIYH
jgi:hypothetical protein